MAIENILRVLRFVQFIIEGSEVKMCAATVDFNGASYFRQRLILSTLSGRPIKISCIRDDDENPGLNEYEANVLRLMDTITNGTNININVTGTVLRYRPGMLTGGTFVHECNIQRSIGYYLEILFCLAPFCKHRMKATLRGVTNDSTDPTVDYYKATTLPVMRQFGILDDLELKIIRRGFAPDGGGEVHFHCPNPKKLRPIRFTDQGKIKRIRGTAYASRISPQIPNRIIESTRSVLNSYMSDIYIYSDHLKGNLAGKSPGFGIVLVAETTTGAFLACEATSNPKGQGEAVVPEDMGKTCAEYLLQEIYRGGCIDSANQSLAALLMVLGEADVSKVLTGPLTQYTIQFLRHIRDFFQVTFKLESKVYDDEEEEKMGGSKVIMTCVGVGYSNLGKATR